MSKWPESPWSPEGCCLGHLVCGDHSRAAGALLQINPRSRQSSAGGALGPAIVEASGGAIDERKCGDVIIARVGKFSERRKHAHMIHDMLSRSLPHIVATTTISLNYLVIYFLYFGLYQNYGMQNETMECDYLTQRF